MTHRIIRRGLVATALFPAVALTLSSNSAHAHGGIPRAFSILFEPGKPDDIVLRSDVWGIFRSSDGGKSWLYGCAEIYHSNSLNADHRNMVIAPGGRIIVAAGFNGLVFSDDLCSWQSSPTFSHTLADASVVTELVQDVVPQGSGFLALTATGVNGMINGQLWKSSDKGSTWAVTGGKLPGDFAGTSLALAPSGAPNRVYASGRHINANGTVERSDDSGMTWTAETIPSMLESAFMRIPLVHPTNPDIFFVWADQPEGLAQNSPDEIYGTKDGGKTFTLFYASMGDLPGLALSPDNSEILISGPLDGILAAKLDDAFANGPKAFTTRSTGCNPMPCQTWGLAWTSAGLYAGTNDFSTIPPRFTLGVSQDSGKTFTKVMDLCDVKYDTTCGATTSLAQACQTVWDTGYAYDYTNGPRCMPGTGGAAGAAGTAGASGTGATSGAAGTSTAPSGGGAPAGGAGAAPGTAGATSGAAAAPVTGTAGTAGASAGGSGGNVNISHGGCSYAASSSRPAVGFLALALGALGLRARRRRK